MAESAGYPFQADERPLFPGSPYTPPHSTARRIGYAGVGVLLGLASNFPNGLVTANIPNLAGELGVYAALLGWLPAVYVAFNATANLSLVKARAQFCIPQVTRAVLLAYLLAGLLQMAWPTFAAAVLMRAVNGVAAAALIATSIFYLLQPLPAKLRVTNGVQLMSLIPADRWVIANFKEAQTAKMAPGQRASFTVDALGGAKFAGRVEQLSPGAGSEFAVLKPDNATGNFVKVPQRIGVRIAVDPDQSLVARLRPGMSVEARVDTRGGR